MARLFTSIAVWCLAALIPTAADAQVDVASIVQAAAPSVVTLKSFSLDGRQIALGSGFVLLDGRVVTNAHVVSGAATVEIFDFQGALAGTAQYAEALSNAADIAVLPRIPNIPGLRLAGGPPAVGSVVTVIGAPEGLSNTVSDGIVSGIRELEGQRLIQITAPISSGSSGGPVLNSDGEVIGVSMATLRDGQNLNFAVPASNVTVLASGAPGEIVFSSLARTSGSLIEGSMSPVQSAELNVWLSGELDLDDDLLTDDSFYELWSFSGSRGDRVQVTLRSDDYDAYLSIMRMVDGRFIEIESNDDQHSFTTNSRITMTLPSDGEYIVRANSLEGGRTGLYTLQIELPHR